MYPSIKNLVMPVLSRTLCRRPSWSQTLRSRPLDVAAIKKSPKSSALLSFIESLSDLSFPKAAIRIISDAARIHGYSAAISGHQQLHQGADVDTAGDDITRANLVYGKRVLCLSAGGGIMPIMCAAAGAHSVTAIERSRMLYRMAKQVLESNMSMLKQSGCDGAIELVPQSLYAFNTESAQTASSSADSPARHGPSSGAPTESITLPASATAALHDHDVLIIDLFDHGILGMGVLPALDYAAGRLLSSSCIVCPSTVYVYACLVQVCLDKPVQGFDLSPLNSYRWYPGSEKIDLTSIPHQKLSKPFLACTVHLQDRVQSKLSLFTTTSEEGDGVLHQESGNHGVHGAAAECCWEIDEHIDVEITGDGWWNGIVYWFELEMPRKMRGSELGDGVREVRLASYIADTPPETTCSAAGDDAPSAMHRVYCPSWGQAIQYTDGMRVTTGSTTTVRVRQDAGQICFMTCPPSCRLRHALTARWHYDMVLDEMRNGAYDAALRKAISKVKCIRNPGDENAARQRDTKVIALDMGAGTGLLSMMAARAGADEVYAAEMSAHMCDVAEETTIMNGFLGKIYVVDRDVRRMDVVAKPNGTAPELPGRVDLAVFEVFDSGLIGEGVLHILAAAKARLLKENAILVPSSAVVYAQPIEMRLDKVAGIDVSQANRWRWRADYEGVELNKCRNQWKPLAEPLPVFSFDFYDVYSCGCPSEQLLSFQITSNGVFNGVAMWFDLHLDEETSLSTSPYAEKGPTWQQAVQWMQELRVTPGDEINITARHDSYSISYEVKEQHNVVLNERFTTGVPMVDPVWKAAHDALHRANAELAKACVQNPLEYRSIAQTSVEFASRPHDVGLDASQAAEFCMKMMG